MSNTSKDCPFCDRVGLSLLPLRLAYVAQAPVSLPTGLTSQSRLPALPVKDGNYALRVISTGFVYVYEERAGGIWRCYGATPTGHMRELPLESAPRETPAFLCGREGHSDVASLINIPNAKQAGTVWVGYSRVWLTKSVRKALKADASLRKLVMVELDASSVVQSGPVLPESGMRVSAGPEIAKLAAEFSETAEAFAQTEVLYAKNTSTGAVPRIGQAGALVQRMQANSPGNAIVLALPDPVGIVQDISHWRNLRAGELAQYQGEAKQLRSRIVGDLILGIKKGMSTPEQAKVWAKRYAPKVNIVAVEKDKSEHDRKVKQFESNILKASHDWCAWVAAPAYKRVWKLYDGMDPTDGKICGAAMECDYAKCVFGSGATPQEQLWWKEWLNADPSGEHNALWLAMAAGDKDLVAYLVGDVSKPLEAGLGKSDKGVDVVAKSKEAREKFLEWLKERKAKGLGRPAQEASGLIANTAASQLQLVAKTQPDRALVAGQRMRVLIATRMDVNVTPRAHVVTLQQFVVQLHETVWGPPTAQLSTRVLEARKLKIAQTVGGAWFGSSFSSTQTVMMDIWLPDSAVKLGVPPPKALPSPQVPAALPGPPLNGWKGLTEYLKSQKNLSGGLLGMGAALQLCNLSATLIQLDRAMKGNATNRSDQITETLYGVLSGSLGVMALTVEITAGVMTKRVAERAVTEAVKKAIGTRAAALTLGGGFLGVASAGVDAYQAWSKAQGLRAEGDMDAATSYTQAAFASGGAMVVGGVMATIAAGATLSAVGASGAAATAVIAAGSFLSAIPVFGWLILLVGAIAVGVFLAYRASTQEDTALEKWLSRCCWRNDAAYVNTSRVKYVSLKEEMAEFQMAMYGLSVTLNWTDKMVGKDEVEVVVVAPGYGKASELAFMLELQAKNGKKNMVVHRSTSSFSEDADLKPQPPAQHFMSAPTPGHRSVPLSEVVEVTESFSLLLKDGVALLSGRVRANEFYFSGAKLKLEYWPDPIQSPELRMNPVPGGDNFILVAD